MEFKMKNIITVFLIILLNTLNLQANSENSFPYTKIGDSIYKIEVNGKSVIASIGSDGVLLCDVGEENEAPQTKSTIQELGGEKIDYIINTHWHVDHSGGNIAFGKDAIIFAHENTRKRLSADKYLKFWEEEHLAFPEYALPDLVFSNRMTLYLNNEEIEIIHLPNGHTDGDVVVYFKNSNILHVGDCLFSNGFPAIDFENGGNVEGFADNLKIITEMMPKDVRIIVSHGPDYTIDDIRKYEKMIRSSLNTIQEAMKNNMSLEAIQQANILDDWQEFNNGYFNFNEWIHIIFQSLIYESEPKAEMKSVYYSERRLFYGQNPPGLTSELFAPGILSTEVNEFNAAFTPSGDAVYFTVTHDSGQSIMVLKKKDGKWQKRDLASFSGAYRDVDPFITSDGKKLFFSSNRPKDGINLQEDCDFWFVEKLESGKWSEAKHLSFPCTPNQHDFYYVSTHDGAVYFSIFNNGKGDLYFLPAKSNNNDPIHLNYPINTKHNEHDPFIAPDGSFLIFTSDRPGGFGSADLYICFRKSDNSWSAPVNMGETINSEKYDYCPILSPDEKYFFFSSYRTGNGDVYWVDAKIIDKLKNQFQDL